MDFDDVDLLAFGEPTHGEPAFPRARDELFKRLVQRGFRSIAVEYDRVAGLAVDDYVQGRSDEPPQTRERQLAEWMRAHNRTTDDRLTFHGFDVPVEMTYAESRDALMARNLLDLHRRSSGPMLVAAHNRHLQRHPGRWHLAGLDLEWRSAGSIVSQHLGDRYAVIVGSLGSSAALGLAPPAPETFEGRLGARAGHGPLFDSATDGTTRTDVIPEQGYFPLDAETVEHADAIWHIDLFPAAAKELADRIRRLPGVESHQSGPGQGVPEVGWDDWFFFVGSERKHPFATIVGHDIPGVDEESGLDRAGVYRLNLDLGRDEFRRLFGYGPEEFRDRRDGIDFARFDELVPHPVYATRSWASVVNPGARSTDDVDRLLRHAHARGSRHGRSRSGA